MAYLDIKAENELFTIGLDSNDWTSLTVNGEFIEPTINGWNYSQKNQGLIEFIAVANLTNTENKGNVFVLKGKGDTCYICVLSYTSPFVVHGTLFTANNIFGAENGPFGFTQPSMQGGFPLK
ncbi:hypothetical protein H2O64_08230 [Kordia sp. YSTF-M3]|uniref:Uncharacterized protein n=1 Tax=Kordia aestuariivivens TaxID=2759037 RepID=A0ABR7Q7W7_9FLAO|nr:hypothetical protein [Kordia aestuariivivens]MBC8754659.1 hypothetical protein [Kordia aestuariivivens]